MIYDFDINANSVELLPPDKRYKKTIAFIQALLSPLQWAHDALFNSYYQGSAAPTYSAGSYNFLNQVIYNKAVYLSLINENVDIPTTTNWYKMQDSFIGLNERILYAGNKIILEYAINKEFGAVVNGNFIGVFRNPNPTDPSGASDIKSDIYITNSTPIVKGFLVGNTKGGIVGITDSEIDVTANSNIYTNIIGAYTLPSIFTSNFQINIPTALYSFINSNATIANQIITNFVNQYIPASLLFTINPI
jgi:hypothetical protein